MIVVAKKPLKSKSMSPIDRPHVTINVAMSADGKTDTVTRRGAAISSPQDMARVDRLRAASDAILVGGRTLLGDDPRLTVKSAELRAERQARGWPENPLKVGIITVADLKLDGRFLNTGPAAIKIFTTQQTSEVQIDRLRERGADVHVLGDRRVNVREALTILKREGVDRLLVEGGGTLNFELLQAGLVDELMVYIAPLIFGGATAPTFADGPGLGREGAIGLQLVASEPDIDGGVWLRYQIRSQEN
jgi:2,5-diamino-6-(ribosylamino)-4(3H)-pyrimidinone 5'-phosphate reductase